MKHIFKGLVAVLGTSAVVLSSMTSCMEEATPTSVITEDELGASSKATEALVWAQPAFFNNYGTYSSSYAYDWGYGSIMHVRDVMTEDEVVKSSSYDWYTYWEENTYLGYKYVAQSFIWRYYYKFIQTSNNLISAISPETATDLQKGYLGTGYAFRAMLYLDIARMYEFLPNDVYGSDYKTDEGNSITNLTVPIITDSITEEAARNNPRATREQMKNFILSDLQKAEQFIPYLTISDKVVPHLDCVYGLYARLYMWVEDYDKAKEYARKAINASSCTPLTESQWTDTKTGFNSLDASSWMWGASADKEDDAVQSGILNWTSWMSNETTFGYAQYGPMTMIDGRLYSQISNTDFRKLSFKAPEGSKLAGKEPHIVYANSSSSDVFYDKMPTYGSFKFRPGEGSYSDYQVACACAYPVMRLEEMYLIEAEAAAHLNASEGKELIETFMKTYRDSKYTCSATSTDDVVDEVFLQKRIELWGEGQIYFDYKRLNKPVDRTYASTSLYENNWTGESRMKTTTRPAWMNFCITRSESQNNSGLDGFANPDPSDKYAKVK